MAQGKRTDLIRVKRLIDDGASDVSLWQSSFSCMVRNYRAFKVYKRSISKPRDAPTAVLLFVGPTNTHKSHVAHLLGNSGYFGSFYVVPMSKGSGLYFDGYDEHKCVLMDEMNGNRCDPTFLNGLTDRNAFTVPVHGSGNINFVASTVIICSNYIPAEWWKKGTGSIAPFMRRISFVWFTGKRSVPLPKLGIHPMFEMAPAPVLDHLDLLSEEARDRLLCGVDSPFEDLP